MDVGRIYTYSSNLNMLTFVAILQLSFPAVAGMTPSARFNKVSSSVWGRVNLMKLTYFNPLTAIFTIFYLSLKNIVISMIRQGL